MSLTQRSGSTVWWWQQRIGGKLYRKSTGVPIRGKAEKALAERRANEFELAVREGRFGYTKAPVPTFREWWKRYQESYSPLKGELTQLRDASMAKHFLPYFGDTPLDQITKTMCLTYLHQRAAAFTSHPNYKQPRLISSGTVAREKAVLQGILEKAVHEGRLATNPMRGLPTPKVKPRERVLTEEEQAKLLAVLTPRYQRLVRFLLGTGCRIDEVVPLDPACAPRVDLENRQLTVIGKGQKTRLIPMSHAVVQIVKDQLAAGGWWKAKAGSIRKRLERASIAAGIEKVTPHVLRHSFATRWITSGGDVFVVSKILGHASVLVTTKHYSHLLRDDLRDAMDARNVGIGD